MPVIVSSHLAYSLQGMTPFREYNVYRKQCLIQEDRDRLELQVNVQDVTHKHMLKQLKLSVPIRITRDSFGQSSAKSSDGITRFETWVESLKIA